jgi:hypothetical protein
MLERTVQAVYNFARALRQGPLGVLVRESDGVSMDRRDFFKLTGLAASASALGALPAAADTLPAMTSAGPSADLALASPALTVSEPGTYQISGQVRLLEPLVQIRSAAQTQSIAWANLEGADQQVTTFTAFERFDRAGQAPPIQVLGGRLEALKIVPLEFD